jgi:Flp pilus assembly protein TadD
LEDGDPEGASMSLFPKGLGVLILCPLLLASGCAAEDDYKKGVEALDNHDYDQAIRHLTKVVKSEPKNSEAWNCRGLAYFEKREFDKAIADFDQATRWDPKIAWAFTNRAMAYLKKKNYRKALADINQAIKLNPKKADYFVARGACYRSMRKYQKAMADYCQAIRLNPKNPNAYNNLAWMYSVSLKKEVRNGKKAVEYGKKACELSGWKNPEYLDTLAAAYAEAGNFKEAVKLQQKTLSFPEYEKRNGKEARDRIKLYKANKPYRESQK